MTWVLAGVAIAASFICGLLGLTAGINLNPASTVRYVPNWGSLGDWVAGIGALLAVITTLVMASRSERQQDRLKRDSLAVQQGASSAYISVRFTSLGMYPAKVKSVLILSPEGDAVPLFGYEPERDGPTFPVRLEFKDDVHFQWKLDRMRNLLKAIGRLNCKSVDLIRLEAITTTESFKFKLEPSVRAALRYAAQQENIKIEH